MSYVLGVDLGTSSIKVALYDEEGRLIETAASSYSLIIEQSGYSEQNPADWIEGFERAFTELLNKEPRAKDRIKGLAIAGQMHSLVLLDDKGEVIRNSILWNDVRTTQECTQINQTLDIISETQNKALEGFTLPKLLWIRNNEPENWKKIHKFMMPKDYLVYYLTGKYATDYSDAAGTLLLNFQDNKWSEKIFTAFDIPIEWAPNLYWSTDEVGYILPKIKDKYDLNTNVKVFAGAADNAAAALAAGIVDTDMSMVSIGTSGVFLSAETSNQKEYDGKIHYFNHSIKDNYYSMGVTLSAGNSLSWAKKLFDKNASFSELLKDINKIKPGSDGLFFTPYIMGERTPYTDSKIRGTFIGIDARHTRNHFLRAVIEGITFSLNDSKKIMESVGKEITKIVSVGGGSKNEDWLQIQADIFGVPVYTLKNEEGPAQGAAMIATIGLQTYALMVCVNKFVKYKTEIQPIAENVEVYRKYYNVYRNLYNHTKDISYIIYELLKD